MKIQRRLSSLALATIVTLVIVGCGPDASAGGRDTLRLSLNQAKEHPSYIALEGFNKYLQDNTDDLEIDVYPNETLGAQAEVIQLVGEGVIDMAVVSGAQLENINDDFTAFGVPRVFDDIDHQMEVVQDPEITSELYSSLEGSNRVTVLGGLTQGVRGIYTTFGPIRTPDDLAGSKIRVQESDLNVGIARALGGSATPMSFGEVYTALQSGIIDAADGGSEVTYATQRHFEVAPYYSYTNQNVGVDYVVINTDALAKMSDEDRESFEQGWNEAWQEHTAIFKTFTTEAIKQAEEEGASFTQVDEAAFAEPLDDLADEFLVTETQQDLYEKAREAAQ